MKFFARPIQALDRRTVEATLRFLDRCACSSAYQFPYAGEDDEWLFQAERDGEICFSGRGGLGYAAGRHLPILKLLSFNRGPVAAEAGDFLEGIERIAHWAGKRRLVQLKVRPDLEVPEGNSLVHDMMALGWRSAPSERRYTLRLDVSQEDDRLMEAFPAPCRYKLKRSEREGIRIVEGCAGKDLDAFIGMYGRMAERKRLSAADRSFFHALWKLREADASRMGLVLATHDNEILGGNLIFRCGRRAEYLFGAVEQGPAVLRGHVSAGYPLQWGGMLWARAAGCGEYDLGGYNPAARGGPAAMKRAFFRNPAPVELCPELTHDLMPRTAGMIGALRRKLGKPAHE